MLKIIAGEFRSRQLRGPEGEDVTRPMTGRVKESVFNLLRGHWEGASVLDLFAGVGTIGLEAISRGARSALLVEQNHSTFKILQENIATLGCEDRAIAMLGDALSQVPLARVQRPVDIVFVDPPYATMAEAGQRQRVMSHLEGIAALMAEQSFLILRSPLLDGDERLVIAGFDGPELHSYGKEMQVRLYAPVQPG